METFSAQSKEDWDWKKDKNPKFSDKRPCHLKNNHSVGEESDERSYPSSEHSNFIAMHQEQLSSTEKIQILGCDYFDKTFLIENVFKMINIFYQF